jgi:hypothetical protein
VVLDAAVDHVAHHAQRQIGTKLPAIDRLLQNLERAAGVLTRQIEHTGAPILGPRSQLIENQSAHAGVVVDHGQVAPDHESQSGARALQALQLQVVVGQDAFVPLLHHADQQLALAGEVAINRAFDHTGPGRDLRRQRLAVTLVAKHLCRHLHDFLHALLTRQPRTLLFFH